MKINQKPMPPGTATAKPLSVVSPINHIMLRIKYAEPESPIAVFISEKAIGLVAVFGSTVNTKKIAIKENQNFVGMFDKTWNSMIVKSKLSRSSVI